MSNNVCFFKVVGSGVNNTVSGSFRLHRFIWAAGGGTKDMVSVVPMQ